MSSARSSLLPASQIPRDTGFLREIGDFVRQFVAAAFNPYRPERHYMRGPGPACRAQRVGSEAPDADVMRSAIQGVPDTVRS